MPAKGDWSDARSVPPPTRHASRQTSIKGRPWAPRRQIKARRRPISQSFGFVESRRTPSGRAPFSLGDVSTAWRLREPWAMPSVEDRYGKYSQDPRYIISLPQITGLKTSCRDKTLLQESGVVRSSK